MNLISEHPLLLVPLGMVYIVVGTVIGLLLKYRVEYHIRRFNSAAAPDEEPEHVYCWCQDGDLPRIVRSWVGWSFAAWPLNLTVFLVLNPLIRFVFIPLFKFILIPAFCYCILKPIDWCSGRFKRVEELVDIRVGTEIKQEAERKARQLADEADKKKHAKVDGAIARADALLKRVDDQVGNSYSDAKDNIA